MLSYDMLASPLRLCADADPADGFGLPALKVPLSPEIHEELLLLSPLSGSNDGLSSPSVAASLAGLHEASSYFEALQGQGAAAVQESAVSGPYAGAAASHPAPSCCSEGDLSQLSDDASNRAFKRSKLEWTPELHAKFVEAVEGLPADKQVPSRILEHMGDWGAGLTRANIASHLQKYRNRKGAAKATPPAPATPVATSTLAGTLPSPGQLAPGMVLGYPCLPLMSASAFPHQALALAPWAALAPEPAPAPAPTMIPTPAAPASCCDPWAGFEGLLPPGEAGAVPEGLARELAEVVAGKRKRGPLGLRLDAAAVMQQWNGGWAGR